MGKYQTDGFVENLQFQGGREGYLGGRATMWMLLLTFKSLTVETVTVIGALIKQYVLLPGMYLVFVELLWLYAPGFALLGVDAVPKLTVWSNEIKIFCFHRYNIAFFAFQLLIMTCRFK